MSTFGFDFNKGYCLSGEATMARTNFLHLNCVHAIVYPLENWHLHQEIMPTWTQLFKPNLGITSDSYLFFSLEGSINATPRIFLKKYPLHLCFIASTQDKVTMLSQQTRIIPTDLQLSSMSPTIHFLNNTQIIFKHSVMIFLMVSFVSTCLG